MDFVLEHLDDSDFNMSGSDDEEFSEDEEYRPASADEDSEQVNSNEDGGQ